MCDYVTLKVMQVEVYKESSFYSYAPTTGVKRTVMLRYNFMTQETSDSTVVH